MVSHMDETASVESPSKDVTGHSIPERGEYTNLRKKIEYPSPSSRFVFRIQQRIRRSLVRVCLVLLKIKASAKQGTTRALRLGPRSIRPAYGGLTFMRSKPLGDGRH